MATNNTSEQIPRPHVSAYTYLRVMSDQISKEFRATLEADLDRLVPETQEFLKVVAAPPRPPSSPDSSPERERPTARTSVHSQHTASSVHRQHTASSVDRQHTASSADRQRSASTASTASIASIVSNMSRPR